MKFLVFSFVVVLVAVTVAEERRCYSQTDCSDGYCCTGGITPWIKGSCKKFAEEGENCDPSPPSIGKYFLNCPCKEGLKCDDSGKVMGSIRCVRE